MSIYSTGSGFCPVYNGQLELEALPLYVLLYVIITCVTYPLFPQSTDVRRLSPRVGTCKLEFLAIFSIHSCQVVETDAVVEILHYSVQRIEKSISRKYENIKKRKHNFLRAL